MAADRLLVALTNECAAALLRQLMELVTAAVLWLASAGDGRLLDGPACAVALLRRLMELVTAAVLLRLASMELATAAVMRLASAGGCRLHGGPAHLGQRLTAGLRLVFVLLRGIPWVSCGASECRLRCAVVCWGQEAPGAGRMAALTGIQAGLGTPKAACRQATAS